VSNKYPAELRDPVVPDFSAMLHKREKSTFSIDAATQGYQAFLESMSEIILAQSVSDDIGKSIIGYVDDLREQLSAGTKVAEPVNWYLNPIFSTLIFLNEDNVKAFNQILSSIEPWVEKCSNAPSIGLHREWQLIFRAVQADCLEHQKVIGILGEHYHIATKNALRCFSLALAETGDSQEINTLGELYDLWIDLAEQSYKAVLKTESFSKDFAAVVNTLSKYKKSTEKISDMILSALHLPDIQVLKKIISKNNKLESQVHELRLELAALRDE
jgi:hypothetical protein